MALKSVISVSPDDLKHALADDEKKRRLRKDKPGPKGGIPECEYYA
jgi:hypothetical protein